MWSPDDEFPPTSETASRHKATHFRHRGPLRRIVQAGWHEFQSCWLDMGKPIPLSGQKEPSRSGFLIRPSGQPLSACHISIGWAETA